MRALIIAGGDLGETDYIKQSFRDPDLIICADSGAKHLKELGITPHFLVGDFDSISRDLFFEYKSAGVTIKEYPQEKDWTDTQIAVDMALEMGAEEVSIVGGLGNRWDHSYANLMLLNRLEKRGVKGVILHSHNTILMSDKTLKIKGKPGETLSLLPFGGDVHIESTEGLSYPLEDFTLIMDEPLGVSNILISEKATIHIHNGWLIGVLAKD